MQERNTSGYREPEIWVFRFTKTVVTKHPCSVQDPMTRPGVWVHFVDPDLFSFKAHWGLCTSRFTAIPRERERGSGWHTRLLAGGAKNQLQVSQKHRLSVQDGSCNRSTEWNHTPPPLQLRWWELVMCLYESGWWLQEMSTALLSWRST